MTDIPNHGGAGMANAHGFVSVPQQAIASREPRWLWDTDFLFALFGFVAFVASPIVTRFDLSPLWGPGLLFAVIASRLPAQCWDWMYNRRTGTGRVKLDAQLPVRLRIAATSAVFQRMRRLADHHSRRVCCLQLLTTPHHRAIVAILVGILFGAWATFGVSNETTAFAALVLFLMIVFQFIAERRRYIVSDGVFRVEEYQAFTLVAVGEWPLKEADVTCDFESGHAEIWHDGASCRVRLDTLNRPYTFVAAIWRGMLDAQDKMADDKEQSAPRN